MKIRPAKIKDACAIQALINDYAEKDLMLHRSLESIYQSLRDFVVAEDDSGEIVGCAATDIYWSNFAEIRSVAVACDASDRGTGAMLINACKQNAKDLGIRQLCAMTYVKQFFEKQGFVEVDIKSLPEKVWRECLEWYAQGHRHETAMVIDLEEVE